MKRQEILNKMKLVEDFNQEEKDWLNDPENEDLIKKFILKKNTKSSYRIGSQISLNSIIDRIGLKRDRYQKGDKKGEIKHTTSKVSDKLAQIIQDVFEDYDHIADSREIVEDLNDNNNLINLEDIGYEKLWKLSDTKFSDKTKLFLLDLYDRSKSFGRNSYGKGDLVFALILKNAKLSEHIEADAGADILIGDKRVEVKASGARMDSRFKLNTPTYQNYKDIFKTESKKYPAIYEFVRKKALEKCFGTNSLDFELTEEKANNWIRFYSTLIALHPVDSAVDSNEDEKTTWEEECKDYLHSVLKTIIKFEYHTETGTDVGVDEYIDKIVDAIESSEAREASLQDFYLKSILYVTKNKVEGNQYLEALILSRKVNDDIYAYRIPYKDEAQKVDDIWEYLINHNRISFSKGDHTFVAPRIRLNIKNIKESFKKRPLTEAITFEKSEDGNTVHIEFESGRNFDTNIHAAVDFAKNLNKKGYITYINGEVGETDWLDDDSVSGMFLRRI